MVKKVIISKVKPETSTVKSQNKSSVFISSANISDLVIILLYALTEFFPRLDAVDIMGSQWLYLSILNCLVTIYIFVNKKFIPVTFFKTTFFLLYSGFIIISALSFFASYNIIESIVTYSRLVVCFIAFLNLISLLYNSSQILKHLFLLIGLIVLYQSLYVIVEFISNYRNFTNLDELILTIKGNTGNKNILAATIVIKIPFLVFAVYHSGFWGRIFYLTALLLSCIALFIVNARASFGGLFLELMIYLILAALYYFKNGKKKEILKNPAWVLGIFIGSILIIQTVFTTIEKQKVTGSYGSVASRIESIDISNAGSSGRIRIWSSAVDFIKKNPVLGGGYGNWKLNSIPYEKYVQSGLGQIEKHAHDDFLEAAADTGVLGGLIYLGLFLCLIWYSWSILKSPGIEMNNKMIIVTVSMALAAYMVDATFNFPFERPNIQVLLAIIAAVIVAMFVNMLQKKNKPGKTDYRVSKIMIAAAFIFSCATIYVNNQVFRSMKLQYKISEEWFGEPKKSDIPFKSDDINPYFPPIPNINEVGMPIACIKAKYLCDEGRYDEAITILNADKNSNPYIYYSSFLRGMIADKLNKPDTAYYYAKIAYYNHPINSQFFKFFNNVAAEVNDTMEIKRSFKEIRKVLYYPDLWFTYSQNMYHCTGNPQTALNIVQDGLRNFPGDTALEYKNNFYQGLILFKQQSYEQSIKFFKEALKFQDNPYAQQNIGLAYYNLGNNADAIPYLTTVINQKSFNDGRTEYFRGMCYQRLGNKNSACTDFMSARSLGYNVSQAVLEQCR